MYADVIVLGVGNPWEPLLTYGLPDDQSWKVGSVVTVPWGKKDAVGVILRIHDQAPSFATKPVNLPLYQLTIPTALLETAFWMSEYYHEPLQRCFETIILSKKAMKRIRARKEGKEVSSQQSLDLTNEQKAVVDRIVQSLDSASTFLLHGVTGSGKTEVYLHCIAEVLQRGKQVIYLVPEIGLTPQTVQRVKARFGETVMVVNSTLSEGERFQLMEAIARKEISIVIGSRSALFTPFENLGLMIIDECHDGSYKQDASPHYLTEEVAAFISQHVHCPVILGSATPTIRQYYMSIGDKHDYTLLSLPTRANAAQMPEVRIADMREELKKRNFTVISDELEQLISETLERKEQVVLFMNRRGFAQAFVCRSCGWRAACPRCSVSLVYHRRFGTEQHVLVCHQCDHLERLPASCKACGSVLVKPLGSGTERVVDDVAAVFPHARIVRMDRDTTTQKGSHEELYASFLRHDYDILIGTQMVTKGWDVANVTCVGIINADNLLHMPMYDASEQAFNLMMQVSGRAGRSKEKMGTVVIQTYSPYHYAITCATHHDYACFYEEEIQYRQLLRYPPYSTLVELIYSHEKQDIAERKATELHKNLEMRLKEMRDNDKIEELVEILGPAKAPIHRVKEIYYYQLLLKGDKRVIDLLLESTVPKDWSINVGI